MTRIRIAALALALVALAGCRDPQAVLEVEATFDTTLRLDQLIFTLTGGDTATSTTLPDPANAPFAEGEQAAAFLLPPELIDVEVHIVVDGLAGGVTRARGEGDVTAVAEKTTSLGVELALVIACGDGFVDDGEACDDDNTADGDGCDASCAVEPGFVCTGAPSACATICGDGLVGGVEACDDGGATAGDGCDDACALEAGFACAGEPTVCAAICQDGLLRAGEACDDQNSAAGDGCDALCATESGFACSGEPSTCATVCGDGLVRAAEVCDDGNPAAGDGCSDSCAEEVGFVCAGEPSTCATVCGDAIVAGAEECDDGVNNGTGADLCRAGTCVLPFCGDEILDTGEQCDEGTGNGTQADQCRPGTCTLPACGDDVIDSDEQCDNGAENGNGPDQCRAGTCVSPFCGDAVVDSAEECDDGLNNGGGSGQCRGTCDLPFCGDTIVDIGEQCDDDNLANTDACVTGCVLPGCGDGFIATGEQCDDGNTADLDGCSSACGVEAGSACRGLPSVCKPGGQVHTVGAGGSFATIGAAVTAASNNDTLFLAAQTYPEIVLINNKNLTIVADPGAVLSSNANGNNKESLQVSGGRTVDVHNLIIRQGGNATAVVVSGAGTTVHFSDCTIGPSNKLGIEAAGGTTVTLQRSLVRDNDAGGLDVGGGYTIENSVLINNGVAGVSTIGGASLATAGTFRFNTVAQNAAVGSPAGVRCAVATALVSSIVFGNNGAGDISGACDGSTSSVGVDPAFAADGFHLLARSPELDAASTVGCPAVDLDGEARPMDSACARGADERPVDPQ